MRFDRCMRTLNAWNVLHR